MYPALRRGQMIHTVRGLLTGGVASIASTVVVTNLLRIVSSVTLTRLLDSYSYGVMGVISSIAVMITMLSDLGLTPFIIRHTNADDERFLDEVWTIRLFQAFMLTVVMAVLATPAAMFLGKPELAPVIRVWGLTFVIEGLSSLSSAIAVRQQKLWRISVLEMIGNVMTLVSSIILALILRNYWAMIIGMLFGQSVRVVLSYTMFERSGRSFRLSRATQRELWLFSRFIAMSSMLSLFVMQFDKVMLAKMMPLTDYGFYAIATTLSIAPEAIANPYAQRVLYPIYARVARENREALRETFYAARRKVTLLYSLGVGGLIGGAPLLVEILYDPRYRPVALLLQLLSIRVFLRMPNLAAHEAIIAVNKPRITLYSNICRTVWILAGGLTALWTNNVLLMVATVATDELPAAVCLWRNLADEGLLDVREEAYGFVAGAVGLVLGMAVALAGTHILGA